MIDTLIAFGWVMVIGTGVNFLLLVAILALTLNERRPR